MEFGANFGPNELERVWNMFWRRRKRREADFDLSNYLFDEAVLELEWICEKEDEQLFKVSI